MRGTVISIEHREGRAPGLPGLPSTPRRWSFVQEHGPARFGPDAVVRWGLLSEVGKNGLALVARLRDQRVVRVPISHHRGEDAAFLRGVRAGIPGPPLRGIMGRMHGKTIYTNNEPLLKWSEPQ